MAFDIVIGADAQPDTGFNIVIGTAAGGSAIDDTGYRLIRIPGGHAFLVRSPLRPSWVSHDELGFEVSFGLDDSYPLFRGSPDPGFAFIVRQPHGWYEEILAEAVEVETPPGPTLTAMQAGNVSSLYVAAIEGYANLLTDGATSAATVAWSGTGYESAIAGLYVRHNPSQQIDPWNPFANTGGRLTLQVTTDSFGVDTHIKSGGNETFADASVDCDDMTLSVRAAGGFNSSGTVYVGTEAMTYSGQTATSFTGLTRGKYSPFLTEADGNLAHPHTITVDDPTAVTIPAVVSSTPRQWIGKWVGLWRHLYDAVSGLLNVKDDALCVFPGRIIEVKDNPETMTTDVECQHVLEYMRDAVLGENPWRAEIDDGIYMAVGQQFDMTDWATASAIGAGANVASPLIVVPGTPANDYEMKSGRRPIVQVMGDINRWLDQALTDGDLVGRYFVKHGTAPDGTTHGRLGWYMTTGSGGTAQGRFELKMPSTVHRMLGGFAGAVGPEFGTKVITRDVLASATQQSELSIGVALRAIGEAVALSDEFGEFFDQSASLPENLLEIVPLTNNGVGLGEIGLVMLNDTQPVVIVKSGSSLLSATAFDPVTGATLENAFDIPWDVTGGGKLRQIYMLRGTAGSVLLQILLSTGTTGHNHATYDVNPGLLGLGIPFGMCSNLVQTVLALNHADQEITVTIDRPKKFIDIIGSDLKIRFAFPRWKSGSLEFYQWVTPTTGVALVEGNKASPVGNRDEQRSVSNLSDRWTRNVIKVDYDRDFTIADTGSVDYHSHVTIIDRAGIDDAGGRKKTETIPVPTSFADSFLGGFGSLSAVLDDFKSTVQMFTRPVRTSRRTIAPTMFEGLSVGDCVLVTDAFARDPSSGNRGVSTRPGIIVSHSYEPGGFTPGSDKPEDMHGEVEVMFLDLLRVGPYVPFANVASVSGTAITVNAHDGSDTAEAVDASWMSAGRKVRIVERDPANPAAPLSWDRVVDSVAGNVVTLTAALSSPTYDAALDYRMVWDDYPDAIAAQQVYSYQADDADYLIADTRAPYQYTANTGLIDWIAGDNDSTSVPELPPDSSYGDGVGLDVGHMQALNRLANNLYDYKTAASAPILFATAITVTKHSNDEWETVLVYPLFLGRDQLNSLVRRKLYVAPQWKSSNGLAVNARITLSKMPPTGSTFLDCAFAVPKATATFSTTSTTYVTSTAVGISFGQLKDLYGVVYLTLEMQTPDVTTTASCRGIAVSYEGPRE